MEMGEAEGGQRGGISGHSNDPAEGSSAGHRVEEDRLASLKNMGFDDDEACSQALAGVSVPSLILIAKSR
jgi:hypothetical protein